MTTTTISAGQNLLDVCLQELGGLSALFDLADAGGLAITDLLTPGQQLPVPASPAGDAAAASYFAARGQRLNTGAQVPTPRPRIHDYDPTDYSPLDYV